MSNCKLLAGKTALITGANRGIGLAIMELFAKNGADIWACTRKENEKFTKLITDFREQYGINIRPLYFDLSDSDAINFTLKTLVVNKEKIDVLINNAGVAHGGFLQMTPISKIKEIFEINFFSQVLVIQSIAKIMMKQKSGSIVNITSIAGIDSNPGYSAYGSSKAALNFITKTLSKELISYNIRTNAIAPGLTGTEMAGFMDEKAKNAMISSSAMNRLAEPNDIASSALFLASDLSSFVNGQIIRVDGGI